MYGGVPYAGGPHAGTRMVTADIPVDTAPRLAVEVAFATDALDPDPVWVDITGDVRWWDTTRGRGRELERFQPGRATVVLGNRQRQYDSVNAAGPWFGNLRPMRRLRIRETFSGVTWPIYDGFIDRWHLDYPGAGHDATATVTATDAFKIFARTDLGRSVYANEVADDAPLVWYRLHDPPTVPGPNNEGTLGVTADGTYIDGMKAFQREAIVVNDPGGSVEVQQGWSGPSTVDPKHGGVHIPSSALNLAGYGSWAIELWVLAQLAAPPAPAANRIFTGDTTTASVSILTQANDPGRQFTFAMGNSVGTTYGVQHPTIWEQGRIYHIVCKLGPAGQLAIYVNGVKSTTVAPGAAGAVFAGTQLVRDLGFGYDFDAGQSAGMLMSNIAVYGTASWSVDPLPDTRVAAHYAAGSAPWQSDLPGVRAGRVLDLAAWPAAERVIDAGMTLLQSAELGTTVLEHLQKIAESEYGLLFVGRDGKVRLVGRPAVFDRDPAGLFGDGPGEIGYRTITPDDGDDVIRNRATISRLGGVAKVHEDTASVGEFGRFAYTLDGLLHSSDTHSDNYAFFVVDEYGAPRRRITSLELGPAAVGQENTLWPAVLGRELGDTVTVRHRPLGGGATFEQVCVVEGINHAGQAGGPRTATWTLSPEHTENF